MVVEAVISLVEWVGTSIYEGGKYVLNYVPQHFKYYMPGAILLLSLMFMFLTVALIAVLQTGEVLIGTNSVSGGFASGDVSGEGVGTNGEGAGGTTEETTTETTTTPATTLVDICGNGICQNFKTSAKYAYEESVVGNYCETPDIIYDIPSYCQKEGSILRRFIIYKNSWSDPVTYQSAYCMQSIYAVVNERCTVSNHSLYYTENSQNCPQDCTEFYDCYHDYTCNDNPNNCPITMQCCGPGTKHEYECMDASDYICDASTPTRSLAELKHVPVHCTCTSDDACAGDWGGTTCCTTGPHTGFCYLPGTCGTA
jgi:hypothetical protein